MLGETLGSITRHFLLMTATPHNGKEEDFQLFMSLLDADRFYGKFRDGAHKVDVADLMRRMVKEDMLKFDGTRLFPERRAYTVNYKLSDPEAALYAAVTDYVKTELNRADQLADGKRKGHGRFRSDGFAAPAGFSPEAIYQSLKRRARSSKAPRRGGKSCANGPVVGRNRLGSQEQQRNGPPEDLGCRQTCRRGIREPEEAVVDQATAAQTIQELEAEIIILEGLEEQARQVGIPAGPQVGRVVPLLQEHARRCTTAPRASPRKLIIFTEHRDTLNYLAEDSRHSSAARTRWS